MQRETLTEPDTWNENLEGRIETVRDGLEYLLEGNENLPRVETGPQLSEILSQDNVARLDYSSDNSRLEFDGTIKVRGETYEIRFYTTSEQVARRTGILRGHDTVVKRKIPSRRLNNFQRNENNVIRVRGLDGVEYVSDFPDYELQDEFFAWEANSGAERALVYGEDPRKNSDKTFFTSYYTVRKPIDLTPSTRVYSDSVSLETPDR